MSDDATGPRARRQYALPVVWAGVLVAASLAPPTGKALAATGPFGVSAGVLFHVAGYAVLAALLVWANHPVAWAVLVATAFGLGVEGLQAAVPYRMAALTDAGANAIGALAGAGTARYARALTSHVRELLGGNQLDDGE